MTRYDNTICDYCTFEKRGVLMVANSNFAPTKKPKHVVRRDLLKATVSLEARFKDSMQLLS